MHKKALLTFLLFACYGSIKSADNTIPMIQQFSDDLFAMTGIEFDEDPAIPLSTTDADLAQAHETLASMQALLDTYGHIPFIRSYMESLIVGQRAVIHWIQTAQAEQSD